MTKTTRDIDSVTGVETTGHEWDGIKELNKPLPKWWLLTFYATIALIYLAITYMLVWLFRVLERRLNAHLRERPAVRVVAGRLPEAVQSGLR